MMPSLQSTDRGVSPVIGVILMLAVTVTLGAVAGTFVLNLGEDVESTPQVGVSVEQYEDGSGLYTVEVQLVSNSGADWVSVENNGAGSYDTNFGDATDYDNGGGGEDDVDEVGERVVVTNLAPGDSLYIQAGYDGGKRVVIRTYTVQP
jgi:flagellin-like protein